MWISNSGTKESSVTVCLRAAIAELSELDQLVKSGDADPRALGEFSNAVDYTRTAGWAVQEWEGLQGIERWQYELGFAHPVSGTRPSRHQACQGFVHRFQVQAVEITSETEGLAQIFGCH